MGWLKPKQEDVMVPCKKCGNKVGASSLRLDLDEKMMICPDCIKNKTIHKEIQKEVFKKPAEDGLVSITKREMPEEATNKRSHKCSSCGYKFMINMETRKPRNCPYCNGRVTSF